MASGQYTDFSPSTTYTNGGFRFTGTAYDYLIGPHYSSAGSDSSWYAYNGTDYFLASGALTISSTTTSPFTVNSLDLVHWYDGQSITQATATGHKVGGGTVTQTFDLGTILNRVQQDGNDFTTFALSGFDDLTSLTITHNGSAYLAMDNLVVNATTVPEPSSLALLGLAIAGCAFMRRRAGNVA